MISENTAQSLHDKATRGEVLTDDEQLLSDDRYVNHRIKSKPE